MPSGRVAAWGRRRKRLAFRTGDRVIGDGDVNRLMVADARWLDRGQLNSEYFLGLRLSPRWTVRAGVGHVATEYRTVEALDGGNRRFRRYTTQGFVGVSRRFR